MPSLGAKLVTYHLYTLIRLPTSGEQLRVHKNRSSLHTSHTLYLSYLRLYGNTLAGDISERVPITLSTYTQH